MIPQVLTATPLAPSTCASIPGLQGDGENHNRGVKAGGEGACIFVAHLFWLLPGAGDEALTQ